MCSMKTLNIYLQESLLDDFDDLEKSTDKRVEELSYIGGQYNVRYIEEEHSFLDNFSVRLLNKLKFKYEGSNSYLLWKGHITRKPSKGYRCIVNLILNTNISLLTEDPKKSDEVEVRNELIKKLYSCSYLADDKDFLQIDVFRSRLASFASWYVNIYNEQDQSVLKISLLKK